MRDALKGPLQELLLRLIIGLTGVWIVISDVASFLDRQIARVERAAVFVGLLAMTFLAFNEYLQRELKPVFGTDLGGLWALDGQMNMALLLLVVVGFLGASLATNEDKHIAVDAAERVLAPGPARFVRRITAFAAAGVVCHLRHGSWEGLFSSSKTASRV